MLNLCISQFQLRPIPAPPSRARVLAFFCLGWQIPGGGDSWAVKFPGWRRKKRSNASSSVNTATFLIDRTVEWSRFKYFNVRFFVSIRPRAKLELFLRRTKLSELSSWKVRRLAQLSLSEWDRPTRSIRLLQTDRTSHGLKILSWTNVHLHMRWTKLLN